MLLYYHREHTPIHTGNLYLLNGADKGGEAISMYSLLKRPRRPQGYGSCEGFHVLAVSGYDRRPIHVRT